MNFLPNVKLSESNSVHETDICRNIVDYSFPLESDAKLTIRQVKLTNTYMYADVKPIDMLLNCRRFDLHDGLIICIDCTCTYVYNVMLSG